MGFGTPWAAPPDETVAVNFKGGRGVVTVSTSCHVFLHVRLHGCRPVEMYFRTSPIPELPHQTRVDIA